MEYGPRHDGIPSQPRRDYNSQEPDAKLCVSRDHLPAGGAGHSPHRVQVPAAAPADDAFKSISYQ